MSFYPRKIDGEAKGPITTDELKTYTKKIRDKVIDCVDYRNHFDVVESDPHWLLVNVDSDVCEELNDPSGSFITDKNGRGGTLTMIVEIENENKAPNISKFYGISCLHVVLPPGLLVKDHKDVDNPDGSDINHAVNQQPNPGNQPDANAVNTVHNEDNDGFYCISKREEYKPLCKAVKKRNHGNWCTCPEIFHRLSLFPLTSKSCLSDLFKVHQRTSTNHLSTSKSQIGDVASVLYGNPSKEEYKLELNLPVVEPEHSHENTFRIKNLTADFVAFSVDNSFGFVKGKTYEAKKDKIIQFNKATETGLSRFVVRDLNVERNRGDSEDEKYYTFNSRNQCGSKALAKCGLLYRPDKVYEKCVRSVHMDNVRTLRNGIVKMYTGIQDQDENERLFGTHGDSGSLVYYIRDEDKACVVVGYIARATNFHTEKCGSNNNCISDPVSCFNELHKGCTPVSCHEEYLHRCTSKNKEILCQQVYHLHGNSAEKLRKELHDRCHLHCNDENCFIKKKENNKETKKKMTSVEVLSISDSLSLLVRNLCMLNSDDNQKKDCFEEEKENLEADKVQPVEFDCSGYKCTPYFFDS